MPTFTRNRYYRSLTLLDSSIERNPNRSTLPQPMFEQVCMLPADEVDFERVFTLIPKLIDPPAKVKESRGVENDFSLLRWEMAGVTRRLQAVEGFKRKGWKDLVRLAFSLCVGTFDRGEEHDDAVTNDESYEISELVKEILRFKQSSNAYYFLKGYVRGKEEDFSFCFQSVCETLLAIVKPSSTRSAGIIYLKRLAVITGLSNEASTFEFDDVVTLRKPWRRYGATFMSDFLRHGKVRLAGDLSMVFRFLANCHPNDKPQRSMPESLDLAGVGHWLKSWKQRRNRSNDESRFDLSVRPELVTVKIVVDYQDFDDSSLQTVEVGLKLRSEEGALTAEIEWSVSGGQPLSRLGIEQLLIGTTYQSVSYIGNSVRKVPIASS